VPAAEIAKGRYSRNLLEGVDRALRVDIKERWQGAREWLAALESDTGKATQAEQKKIVEAKETGEIRKVEIFKPAGGAREMEQARGATVGQRFLGDQLLRQVKVKVGNQHSLDYMGGRACMSQGAFDPRAKGPPAVRARKAGAAQSAPD